MEIHAITPDDVKLPANTGIKAIPADEIDGTFKSESIDLASSRLGSVVLGTSDEWFASSHNLINPSPPIRRPGVFTHAGAWYDGWETRRHNPNPFDWVVIRLGVASGKVRGIEVDTAFFDGNHAPEIAVEGCFLPSEPSTAPSTDATSEDKQVTLTSQEQALLRPASEGGFKDWQPILPLQPCGPSRRQAWLLPHPTQNSYTHVRLQMHPDGGIARFRLYGTVIPVLPASPSTVFDLAATINGGVAVSCSDQHFGTKDNLFLPGRGVDMGDGWETKRSRGVHVDWVVVKLGTPGVIEKVVVDTAHFRGNFPQKVQVFAAEEEGGAPGGNDHERWTQILAPSKTGPDQEHEFGKELVEVQGRQWAFVKMVIIPDGGVKRLRVFGRKAA